MSLGVDQPEIEDSNNDCHHQVGERSKRDRVDKQYPGEDKQDGVEWIRFRNE